MGREYKYSIVLDPDLDDGGYTVTVPALPGIVTQGETFDEAVAMAKEAIQCHIEGLIADGEPVPKETQGPKIVIVSVAA
jgi:antitoxin HicB